MRTINLLLFSICISIKLTAQVNYKISSEIPTSYSEFRAFLQTGAELTPLPVADGKFEYVGELDSPDMLILLADFEGNGQTQNVLLFITGGEIELSIKENKTIEIINNKDAKDCYYKLSLPVLQWNAKIRELDDKLTFALENKSADTSAIRKEYEKALDGCFQVPQDFIKANPNSLVSIQALYYMEKGKDVGKPITLQDLERMYKSLSDAVRNSDYGKQYAADLAKWKEK